MPDQNYEDYSVEDFLQDEFFINGMLHRQQIPMQYWNNWIKEHPHRKSRIEEAKQKLAILWSFKKMSITAREEQDAWVKVAQQIGYQKVKTLKISTIHIISGLAACLLIAVSLFLYQSNYRGNQLILSASTSIKSIKLNDGTYIILNKGARLERYSRVEREVWIRGQVYFEVNKAKDRLRKAVPFIVHTKNFNVKVTGTTFQISTESNQEGVILKEGRVELSKDKAHRVLAPGQYGMIKGEQIIIKEVDPSLYTAWKDREYSFSNTTLSDLGTLVRNLYGMELLITYQPAFRNKQLNGVVNITSRQSFMKTIAVLLDANITEKANKIVISPKRIN